MKQQITDYTKTVLTEALSFIPQMDTDKMDTLIGLYETLTNNREAKNPFSYLAQITDTETRKLFIILMITPRSVTGVSFEDKLKTNYLILGDGGDVFYHQIKETLLHLELEDKIFLANYLVAVREDVLITSGGFMRRVPSYGKTSLEYTYAYANTFLFGIYGSFLSSETEPRKQVLEKLDCFDGFGGGLNFSLMKSFCKEDSYSVESKTLLIEYALKQISTYCVEKTQHDIWKEYRNSNKEKVMMHYIHQLLCYSFFTETAGVSMSWFRHLSEKTLQKILGVIQRHELMNDPYFINFDFSPFFYALSQPDLSLGERTRQDIYKTFFTMRFITKIEYDTTLERIQKLLVGVDGYDEVRSKIAKKIASIKKHQETEKDAEKKQREEAEMDLKKKTTAVGKKIQNLLKKLG